MNTLKFALLGAILGIGILTIPAHSAFQVHASVTCPECGPTPPLCNPDDPDCK